MSLVVAQLKEIYRVTKLVAREPLGPEHRVLIRHRQGRVVRPNGPALVWLHELDAEKRSQNSLRLAFESLNPAAAGKAFLDMLAVFAEFETNLRRERQLEGIAKAKANGVYKGGKPRIDREAVLRLKGEGKGPTEIARELGMSRMHVYRVLRETT